MKRWSVGGFLLLAAATTCMAAAHPRKPAPAKPKKPVVTRLVRLNRNSHKPSAPIRFALEPGEVVADGQQRARVTVTPLVDADQMEIQIETRDGLALGSGPRQWQVGARQNTPVPQDVMLTTSGKGERGLNVIATLHFADGTTMTGLAAYVLNPATPAADTPVSSSREMIINGEKLEVTPLPPGR